MMLWSEWFAKTFDVHEINDLAQLSVAEIEIQLIAEGRSFCHADITRWVSIARVRSSQLTSHEALKQLEVKRMDPNNYSNEAPISSQDENNNIQPLDQSAPMIEPAAPTAADEGQTSAGWTSVASFILEFQTREHEGYSEQQVLAQQTTKPQEKVNLKLDAIEIYDWMQQQVNETLAERPENQHIKVIPLAIEINQVRFLQPQVVSAGIVLDSTHALPTDVLLSDQPVAVEASFKLSGSNLSELTRQALPYQIQGKFHNRVIREDIPLSSSQPTHLVEGQHNYTVRLSEVSLPPGTYRFEMVIMLHQATLAPAMFDVPILQVV